ncbi:MAG: hypothetical protein WCQ72_05120 [Eubacteriales bacterium]
MYIIGIAGGSCSGKTTLTGRLEQEFKANGFKTEVLHMDAYFKNPTPTAIAPITRVEYPEHNHPDSFRLDDFYADIDRAASGGGDILIIEGLLVLYLDRVREKLDLKVFVDLQSDERIIRRVKRFMRDRGQTLDEVASRYLDTVRYRHNEFVEPSRWHADIVVNGTGDAGFSVIAGYVCAKLKK